MSAITFALISYFGWAIGDIFGTISARKIGAYETAFWRELLAILVFIFFAPFFLNYLNGFSVELLLLNIILSIIGTIGVIAFYEGLRIGNAAIVGTVGSSFVAVVVILSILILKESVNLYQSAAILLIFVGLSLAGFNFRELRRGGLIKDRGVFFGLIAMFCWGIYFTFIKILIEAVGWYWPAMISLIVSVPIIFLFMKIRKIRMEMPAARAILPALFANAVFLTAAELSYNSAISKGLVVLVAPIAGSYPTLFVILAFLIFKDPIKRHQIAGIIITLCGIVLLSFLSV